MAGKQAKVLSLGDVNDLLVFASCTRHSLRNCVIVLLAAKAGLRAGEIANLTWDMVVGPTGAIGSVIELRDTAAKNGSGRLIPVHPDLRQALVAYRDLSTGIGPVIRSERGGPMTPLSIVVWFNRAFRNIGLTASAQGRWVVARRPVARRSPVDPDHATVHRHRSPIELTGSVRARFGGNPHPAARSKIDWKVAAFEY
jgi:integrase